MSLPISVVVPTCGRPGLLERCLKALAEQDLEPSGYEVVVVDDAGSRETRRLVERWGAWGAWGARKGLRIRYLVPETRSGGPGAARNRGWRAAEGEIVAFTDDDCVPRPAWLRRGLAALAGGAAGACGAITMPLGERPRDHEKNAAEISNAEFATANCFYRREALARAGGFDERFRAAWREDSDLFFTVLESGARVVRAPHAEVVHPVRPAPWGVSLLEQRKILFDALLYKKHPRLYRERIPGRSVWRYYPTVGTVLVAGAAALAGLPGIAFVACGVLGRPHLGASPGSASRGPPGPRATSSR